MNTGGPALLNGASTLLGTIAGYKANKKLAEQQQEWNEKMMDKQNEWSLNMWNMTNEYNTPSAQVQRMRDAGLNPLYYGLDGSSANGLESAQALGYQRAEAPNFGNVGAAALQGASIAKDIELKNAQIDKLGADAESTKLDNEFKERTMGVRAESLELGNSLTKENIAKAKEEKKQITANIKKIEEETKNESFRGLLIQAQTRVQDAQEKEIIEMLPYKKLLVEAQTEAQKAAAMASFYNAMTQKGLLDAGYIDKYIEGMQSDIDLKKANVKSSEAIAALNEFKSAIRSGNIYTINDNDFWLTKVGKQLLNSFFNDVSILGEAITGPIAGILK